MPATKRYFIGLMSGTSVDGIDCAVVDFSAPMPRVVAAQCHPLPDTLRAEILALCAAPQIALSDLGRLDIELGHAFAAAVLATLNDAGIDPAAITAIGSHGQTVFHQPNAAAPFSTQIGNPNVIAETTGITTVADFRQRDVAAGGQGAPLAPLLHRHCLASANTNRFVVNIGGIANVTALFAEGTARAFDTGPGNVLMDYWIAKQNGDRFDANGNWARGGIVDPALLQQLLATPYLALSAPKSTGRELFNGAWLESQLDSLPAQPNAQDVQATLLEFTARTIAAAVGGEPGELLICGGGAHNSALMARLAELTSPNRVSTTASLGMDPDWVEAVAFAWMAQQTVAGIAQTTAPFTGARKPVVLGGIFHAEARSEK